VTCANCGEVNPGQARFCLNCGAPLGAGGRWRGARKVVTVVFSDVTGSTALGERLDTESLSRIMARYFDAMRTLVEWHHGVVQKFVGDAVVAVFGVPIVREDDALRAVRAAAAMQDHLAELNAALARDWGVGLRIRIGVSTGEVMVGDARLGGALVIGDTVNLATRLEAAARPGEILLDRRTWHLARDAVVVVEVTPEQLAGSGIPGAAYRLIDVSPDVPGHLRRQDSPLVGRDDELRLFDWIRRRSTRESTCHLLTVLGAAGVGKSRLVAEAVGAAGRQATALVGHCPPDAEGNTFWPIAEVVRGAAEVKSADSPDEAQGKLTELLSDAPDGPRVAGRIGRLIGLEATPLPAEETGWAVRRFLEVLASRKTLVARLDHLDGWERAVLERGAVVGEVFERAAVVELSPSDVRPAVPDHLLSLIRKELLRSARSGLSGGEAFRFRHLLVRDAAYGAMPKQARADLHERFAAWLERTVGERVREYEEIIGHHLEQAYRYRSELGPTDAGARAVAARAAGQLAAAGNHAFARADMPAAANLLGRAAALLPDTDAGRLELLPNLARALTDSGRLSLAEATLTQATELARATGDRRAEAHAELGRYWLRYYAGRGGWLEDTMRGAEQLIPVFERLGDDAGLAKTWRLLSEVHLTRLHIAASEAAAARAVEHARRAGDENAEASGLGHLAVAGAWGRRPVPDGIRRTEAILAEARGRRDVEAAALKGLAGLRAMSGDFDAARELMARHRAIIQEIGRKLVLGGSAQMAAYVEMLAGDARGAERELRRGYEILDSASDRAYLPAVAAMLAHALEAQGRYQEAERYLERAWAMAVSRRTARLPTGRRAVRRRPRAGRPSPPNGTGSPPAAPPHRVAPAARCRSPSCASRPPVRRRRPGPPGARPSRRPGIRGTRECRWRSRGDARPSLRAPPGPNPP
jgi:class 3 adenylate cyclase/tetratricopeptide (TPR) repeat protein